MIKNVFAGDIIIVGAGPIGLTLANLCAKQGFKVAVIERGQALEQKSSNAVSICKTKQCSDFDIRCFAISRASQKILTALNIWEKDIEPYSQPYAQMTVWDGSGFGEITFNASEVSEPDLGHIIEHRVLMKSLWENARAQENLSLFFNQSPQTLEQAQEQAIVTLQKGERLSAKLVIGAEGAESGIRKLADIEIKQESYQQHALVATVQTEYAHQSTAWQRFLPEGPIAFLPLSDPHFSSIVWTASPETTQHSMQLTLEHFYESVAKAFDYRLGKIINSSERKCFPLAMIHAKQYVKPRIAIIGDAAHVIHPLAGQGVNLGMQDVAALMEVLLQAKQRDCDIGEILILRKYERSRKRAVIKMIHSMKFFKELFGTQSELISMFRSIGLNITNKTPFLKQKFIREAMQI